MLSAALLVIGCRSSDDGTLEGEVPEVGSTTSTTRIPSTTTTSAPACKEVFEITGEPEVVADLDGDGQDDRVHLAALEGRAEEDRYRLQVVLGAGGGADTPIEADAATPPAVLGAEVLDEEDGREVLWVRVGAGAATTILGLYHLDGCTLETATFENDEPVELPIGGTVGTANGAKCGSDVDPQADVLAYEATLLSGREYEVVTTEFRWTDGMLAPSPTSPPRVTRTEDLSEVSGFRCGDLSL